MMIRYFLLLLLFCGLAGARPQADTATQTQSEGAGFTCRGEIRFRSDHVCESPFVLTATSVFKGGGKVDQEIGVGADGNFVVTAEEGAIRLDLRGGSLCCEVGATSAYPNGVPRLQLRTNRRYQCQFTFRSSTDEDLKGLEVEWFNENQLKKGWVSHPIQPDKNGVFHFSANDWAFWVQASAEGHATFARYFEFHDEVQPLKQITLQPLARVSGKLVSAKGHFPGMPWLFCETPFRPEGATDFTRRVAVTDGTFDIWVPANSEITLSVEQEYGVHEFPIGFPTENFGDTRIPALKPGQHLEGFALQVSLEKSISGRIVYPDGSPVVGAYVRDMRSLLGTGTSDPSAPTPPRDIAITDAQGRFLLFGDGLYYDNHLAVALEVPSDDADGGRTILRQHYKNVSKGEGVFTFQPGAEVLAGRLMNDEGEAVANATLHLTPMEALEPTDEGISCYDYIALPFMEPSPWANAKGVSVFGYPASICELDETLTYVYPVTGPDGAFRVEHLPAGPWKIRVEADGYAGRELSGVVLADSRPFEFVMQPACELVVSVFNADGTPAKGSPFYLNRVVEGKQVGRSENRQHADRDGVLRYSLDEAGTYKLERAGNPSWSLVVSLKNGERVIETLREVKPGSVSGVLDWPGAPERVRVRLLAPGLSLYRSYGITQFGRFHFENIPPGVYSLKVDGGLTKEMQARLDIPPIEVLPGQVCEVIVRLKPELETPR